MRGSTVAVQGLDHLSDYVLGVSGSVRVRRTELPATWFHKGCGETCRILAGLSQGHRMWKLTMENYIWANREGRLLPKITSWVHKHKTSSAESRLVLCHFWWRTWRPRCDLAQISIHWDEAGGTKLCSGESPRSQHKGNTVSRTGNLGFYRSQ